jgi:hypothetical protein
MPRQVVIRVALQQMVLAAARLHEAALLQRQRARVVLQLLLLLVLLVLLLLVQQPLAGEQQRALLLGSLCLAKARLARKLQVLLPARLQHLLVPLSPRQPARAAAVVLRPRAARVIVLRQHRQRRLWARRSQQQQQQQRQELASPAPGQLGRAPRVILLRQHRQLVLLGVSPLLRRLARAGRVVLLLRAKAVVCHQLLQQPAARALQLQPSRAWRVMLNLVLMSAGRVVLPLQQPRQQQMQGKPLLPLPLLLLLRRRLDMMPAARMPSLLRPVPASYSSTSSSRLGLSSCSTALRQQQRQQRRRLGLILTRLHRGGLVQRAWIWSSGIAGSLTPLSTSSAPMTTAAATMVTLWTRQCCYHQNQTNECHPCCHAQQQ